MRSARLVILPLACLLLISAAAPGPDNTAETDPGRLDLDRIFTHREFTPQTFGPVRLPARRDVYTTLEKPAGEDSGQDIVAYRPGSGRRKILVSARHLIPPGGDTPLEIENYRWSKDGSKLLVFTAGQKVWRRKTRGDYWMLDLKTRQLTKIAAANPPATTMFAKFSPQGDRVAYVFQNDIYIQDLAGRTTLRLTDDGSQTLINGTFDWVYEEEFGLRDGYRWSPDGRHIAYWQLDTSKVENFHLLDNTASLYPRITSFPYPKVGQTNPACRVGVVACTGGKTRWFQLSDDPRNNYVAYMEWASSPDEVLIQHLNRRQNHNRLLLGNTRTGTVQTILEETDETWVEVVDRIEWLDRGKRFTWISERDGWRHVYAVSRSGRDIRLLTPGRFDVVEIAAIDQKRDHLYYVASPDNPGQRYLYRTTLDGKGKARRLTPTNRPGTHTYQIAPTCRWAVHTYSAKNTPPTVDLVRLPSHRPLRTLVENRDLKAKVAALEGTADEFFRITIDPGVQLDGWCIKPTNMEPDKRYPLLFYVYGEPWGQTVQDRWTGNRDLWHHMLAQRGYLVMSVDNRGTAAPRGRAWRKSIYGQIGILASRDQAAALKAIVAKYPYVDPGRIGIWGWSGGGSMSLNAIFRYPELYHTAVAVAPVPDQKLYDSIYQERYMGLLADNARGYKEGSPITYAHQLRGNLLLVHGTGDDNVHYQGSETLINALVAAGKHFTMMAYPNRSHSISEGENTTRHLYGLLTRYLKENLPPGPRDR